MREVAKSGSSARSKRSLEGKRVDKSSGAKRPKSSAPCVRQQILPQKPSGPQLRVFEESDFPPIAPEGSGLSRTAYSAYKRSKIGQLVPEQHVTDERLAAAGYTSWLQYCIESPMLNWQ